MAATSMVSIIIGPISGTLSDRFGAVWFSTLGAFLTLTAYWLMMEFNLETKVVFIVSVLVISGLGVGFFQSPNNSTILGSVAKDRLGTASALLATQRQVGLSLGMAAASTIYTDRKGFYARELTEGGLSLAAAAVRAIPPAFHDALIFSVTILCAVFFLCLLERVFTASRKNQSRAVVRPS